MKKQNARKLRLDRETLAPLQDDLLAAVAGGAATSVCGTTTSSIVSRLVCPPSLQIVCAQGN